jgi:hypothetical protein
VPVTGEIVTLRRTGRSSSDEAARSPIERRIVSIASSISMRAKAAPMQRLVPPPNGIQPQRVRAKRSTAASSSLTF